MWRQGRCRILIHTSVKLVTYLHYLVFGHARILIHTSVKLVTRRVHRHHQPLYILIHTSVKLVTYAPHVLGGILRDFNPHEREARDWAAHKAILRSPEF